MGFDSFALLFSNLVRWFLRLGASIRKSAYCLLHLKAGWESETLSHSVSPRCQMVKKLLEEYDQCSLNFEVSCMNTVK